MVNPGYPFLGASPDRKVIDPGSIRPYGLVEIKVMYKYSKLTPEEAAEKGDFFLEKLPGEKIQLKHTDERYFQVQGQMAISKVDWCDFVVYSTKEIFVERIPFDKQSWESKMFPKLTELYLNHAVPYLYLNFCSQ